MNNPLPDALARNEALDTEQSCIVQAPAGSGKTELLTLRFLKLLSLASEPEEVLAITFTKKAASEMRDRIVSTLQWAVDARNDKSTIEEAFLKQRLDISLTVIDRDLALGWHLLSNPSRLRVQTIDSFCFYLASQLPVLSQVGGSPVLSDDMSDVYEHAVRNTLEKLNTDSPISDDIGILLTHLDNNVAKAEKLLIELLNKRDQWIAHVLSMQSEFEQAQDYLRENLAELIEESLFNLSERLAPFNSAIAPLLRFSAQNAKVKTSLTQAMEHTVELPEQSEEFLPHWRILVDMLLTKEQKWRTRIDANIGFPPASGPDKEFGALCKQRKAELTELISLLKEQEGLLEQLHTVRQLPSSEMESGQWQLMGAVARILIQLSAELLLSFSHFGVMDYTQAGAAARNALGTENNPTDLALALDHRIQHILVDEFQDTSQLQLEILEQLTLGWQSGDGRTLFLVGDAMQSCYGFRNANVGIYLNVQAKGIGDVNLNPLVLQANFRSQSNVVSWVNKVFGGAFPKEANSSRGAVPYAKSEPIKDAIAEIGVSVSLVNHDGNAKSEAKHAEARIACEKIQLLQKNDPDSSIAILVRSRSHLAQIIPMLKDMGIHWQATDIDRLGTLPVIEDLLTLTRALASPNDRLAWYALLRGPWCGLTSADLFFVAQAVKDNSVWLTLKSLLPLQKNTLEGLSDDGLARLGPVLDTLAFGMSGVRRLSFRHVVETTWTLLRGHDLVRSPNDLESAAHYFDLLEHFESNQSILNLSKFEDQVKQSFVTSRNSATENSGIHMLTMHKAKGLEYDHVILLGLDRTPISDDKPLLQWYERLNSHGENKLFLAALGATGQEEDDLYKLIRAESKAKNLLEDTRLLYIAVTRAKKSALLVAVTTSKNDNEHKHPANSLLARIWPQLEAAGLIDNCITVAAQDSTYQNDADEQNTITTPLLRTKEPITLSAKELESIKLYYDELERSDEEDPSEQSVDEKSAIIGTIIHRCLEVATQIGSYKEFVTTIDNQRDYWCLLLHKVISSEAEVTAAVNTIESTVTKTLTDPKLEWLFTNTNETAKSELSVTNPNQKVKIIDRTLIDENDTRWLIDFKTGIPSRGQSIQEFKNSMVEKYTAQLQEYSSLFKAMENRPLKLALLLTAIGELVELQ